jgi:hypothetical protein
MEYLKDKINELATNSKNKIIRELYRGINAFKMGYYSCEHGNEPSGSIECWKVLEQLHNWRLLKKGSVPCS